MALLTTNQLTAVRALNDLLVEVDGLSGKDIRRQVIYSFNNSRDEKFFPHFRKAVVRFIDGYNRNTTRARGDFNNIVDQMAVQRLSWFSMFPRDFTWVRDAVDCLSEVISNDLIIYIEDDMNEKVLTPISSC